ncbi:MAG: hypothetical protein PVI91_00040 [Gammaproteobacteria bacterium]|jgi:hypothetical protein
MNQPESQRGPIRTRLTPGLLALAAYAVLAGPATGRAAICGLDLARSADADAYYLAIRYDSRVAPETVVQVRGRLLRLRVYQDARGPEAVCRSRISRTFTLPPDAEPGQMVRYEKGGRVVIAIPRRRPSWP